MDSDGFARYRADRKFFTGCIIDVFTPNNNPDPVIDSVFFNYQNGRYTSQRKLSYTILSSINYQYGRLYETFLSKIQFDADSISDYDENGQLLKTTRANKEYDNGSSTPSSKTLTVYHYYPSTPNHYYSIERKYYGNNFHERLDIVSLIKNVHDTLGISKYYYSMVDPNKKTIYTSFYPSGDTVNNMTLINDFMDGPSLLSRLKFISDTTIKIPIRFVWNNGELAEMKAEHTLFLNQENAFVNSSKFIKDIDLQRKEESNFTRVSLYALINYIDIKEGIVPEDVPYIIMKYKGLDNGTAFFLKSLRSAETLLDGIFNQVGLVSFRGQEPIDLNSFAIRVLFAGQ